MENGYYVDVKEIGKRIKKRREEKEIDLTLDQLAERTQLGGKSVLSKYENGHTPRLTVDALLRIADALDCEPDYLVGRIKHPKRTTSEISEKIPLSREAIESLEYLKDELLSFSNYDAAIVTSVLDSLIIGITEQIKGASKKVVDGRFAPDDDFMNTAFDLLFAYESIVDYESQEDRFKLNALGYNHAKLAVNGLSFKIGTYLSSMVTKAIREMADPKHQIKTEV